MKIIKTTTTNSSHQNIAGKHQLKRNNGEVATSICGEFASVNERDIALLYALFKESGTTQLNLNLSGRDLTGAALSNVDLRGSYMNSTILNCAVIHRSCLSNCAMVNSSLEQSFIKDTNFECCKMQYSNIRRSLLRNVQVRYTDLMFSNFEDSNLDRCFLEYNRYCSAIFRNTIIDGKILKGANPVLQVAPIGSRADMVTFLNTKSGLFIKTGCIPYMHESEFLEAVQLRHADTAIAASYRGAIRMAKSCFKADGK